MTVADRLRIGKSIAGLFILYSILSITSAEDTLRLTLDDCLARAVKLSPDIQQARMDSLAAAARWQAAKAERFPQVSLSGDIPNLSESIDEAFVYDPETGTDNLVRYQSSDQRWQGALSLEQVLPWGATLDLSSRLYRRSWRGRLFGDRDSFTEYSLLRRAMLNQPLLNGNPVRRELELARLNWINALTGFEIQRREVIFGVTAAFYGLVQAQKALEIAARDLESGRDSDSLARRKLMAGLIPEVELLQIQVDLARREGAYREAEDAAEAASDRLKIWLDIPFSQPIDVNWDDRLIRRGGAELTHGAGERPELAAEKINLARSELETRAAIRSERARAWLQIYYELDTRRDQLNDLKDAGDRNIGVTFHFEIPLMGFGTTSARVQELRAQLNRQEVQLKAREASLAADTRAALRAVQRAADRIRIAEAAVELSEKSYAITADRFENGLIDSRALLDAQLDLTRTRREALNARIDYELAVALLDKIAPIPPNGYDR